MGIYSIKKIITEIMYVVVIIFIIYKSITTVNELYSKKIKKQIRDSRAREIKAYEIIEKLSKQLLESYDILNEIKEKEKTKNDQIN